MASGNDDKNIKGLDLPQEGSTDWAGDLDDFCTAIDEHDHTPGKGKPITLAALAQEVIDAIGKGGGGGGGLSTVVSDDTLKGDGSTEAPLGLADAVNETLAQVAINTTGIRTNTTAIAGHLTRIGTLESQVEDLEDEEAKGGNPSYVKFEIPAGTKIADIAGGWYNVVFDGTSASSSANDDGTIGYDETSATATELTLDAGLYHFNLSIHTTGPTGGNDRKTITYRVLNGSSDVLAGEYPTTYVRGEDFTTNIIGGGGIVRIDADGTAIKLETGVEDAQDTSDVTSIAGGYLEIYRVVRSVVSSVQTTSVTRLPVSGIGTSGDPITVENRAIGNALLADGAVENRNIALGAVNKTELHSDVIAELDSPSLASVVGGSGITVTHSNGNKRASIAVASSLQSELIPSGGLLNQALLKQTNADHDVKWSNTTNIYEYKAAIIVGTAGENPGSSSSVMGIDTNFDPSSTPAYTGKQVTLPSLASAGTHAVIPSGNWSIYVTANLRNTNITGAFLQVVVGGNVVPSSSVEGVLDDKGDVTFVTSFTLEESSNFLFNIITTGASGADVEINSPPANTPLGHIYIREGVTGPLYQGSPSITIDGTRAIRVANNGVDAFNLDATNSPSVGDLPSFASDGRFTWTPPSSGGGGGSGQLLKQITAATVTVDPTANTPVGDGSGIHLNFNTTLVDEYNNDNTDIAVDTTDAEVINLKKGEYVAVLDYPVTNDNIGQIQVRLGVPRSGPNKGSGGGRGEGFDGGLTIYNYGRLSGGWDTTTNQVDWRRLDSNVLRARVNVSFEDDSGDKSLNLEAFKLSLIKNVFTPIRPGSITNTEIDTGTIEGFNIGTETINNSHIVPRTITPIRLADAFEWTVNGSNVEPDTTATEEYMLAYKKNESFHPHLPAIDRPQQWVHARLGGKFKLVEQVEGEGLSAPRANFSLDIIEEAIRQQEIRNPLNIENFVGATVLETGTRSGGAIYPTALDAGQGNWVTEAQAAPGFTFKTTAGFTIARGRTAQTRTMTHLLVRLGFDSTARTGGDTLRKIAIDPKASGARASGIVTGDILNEIMIPLTNTYLPPVPSPTNPSGTNRGTGDEYSFYNLGFRSGSNSPRSVGIRVREMATGEKVVDVISNSSNDNGSNIWISFHIVRGIGG